MKSLSRTGFGQYVDPFNTIRGILGGYPFSIGFFREILQNSDDAKATKQIFVLDRRQHPTQGLYSDKLANTQGPALLAYNDTVFCDDDWNALRSIQSSSKRGDTSTIGKYGMGFRSCYHLTDTPQILSGSDLVIFDIHQHFDSSGGVKLNFVQDHDTFPGQLSGFDAFLKINAGTDYKPFEGTVFRFPLRTKEIAETSGISNKSVEPAEIHQLFLDFIQGSSRNVESGSTASDSEISISLLFLTHVSSIELREIDEAGNDRCMTKVSIIRTPPTSADVVSTDGAKFTTYLCSVTVGVPSNSSSVTRTCQWRILSASYPKSQPATLFYERLGISEVEIQQVLAQHKLRPEVALAIPLCYSPSDATTCGGTNGRLFTYLPLPLRTGFPCHVNALFALTQSRQSLCNSGDIVARGSDASVLIAWNKILFEEYIPKTWAAILPILLEQDHVQNIFSAWPPNLPYAQCGDSSYNHTGTAFPQDLCIFEVVALNSAIVASHTDSKEILEALVAAGLRITLPPAYIVDLIRTSGLGYTSLSPETAYRTLLLDLLRFRPLPSACRRTILIYLLSNKDLNNIVGLPLLPLMNGSYTSLLKRVNCSGTIHTLLDRAALNVFTGFDSNGIALDTLTASTSNLLLRDSGTFNVSSLTCSRVIEYLNINPNPIDLHLSETIITSTEVTWLSKFWIWVESWAFKHELHPRISDLYLLPSQHGVRTVNSAIFSTPDMDTLSEALELHGLSFIHSMCKPAVKSYLTRNFILRSVNDIRLILGNIYTFCPLRREAAEAVLSHIDEHLPDSNWEPLTSELRSKLRSLEIFPILLPSTSPAAGPHATTMIGNIPDGFEVISVMNVPLLPIVPRHYFLDGSRVSEGTVSHLTGKLRTAPLSEQDVLKLALNHFSQQRKYLQHAFVKYMVDNRGLIPYDAIQTLQHIPFVLAGDGTTRAPRDIIDPASYLATLYEPRDNCVSAPIEDVLVRHLRNLGVLRTSLTLDMIEERILHVSGAVPSPDSKELAFRLLHVMHLSGLDFSSLKITPGLRWLPTPHGLRDPKECMQEDNADHRRELFDEVLDMLDSDIHISASLREALGWDKPLSLDIIYKQVDLVLGTPSNLYRRLKVIFRELGRRINDLDVNNLSRIIGDRPCIPISDICTAKAAYATFSPTLLLGFHQIPPSLARNPGTKKLLSSLGCTDRPSTSTLLRVLQSLEGPRRSSEDIKEAILILKHLPSDLNKEERAQVVVPDISGGIYPVEKMYFNDIGDRSCLVDPGDRMLAHLSVDDDLARKIGLERLGLLSSFTDTGIDMGEQLPTRIRNLLKQYTEQQILSELLANAADSGATAFGIVLDEKKTTGSKLLSAAMMPFQSCPSLVIYNNSTFSRVDFDGICTVGTGGKTGRTDTIGQFGLGALSMFHFTEMVTIVSGNRVLFLDPSKSHLPLSNKSSLLFPLDHIRRMFPDQLAPLDGLFEFSNSVEGSYDATLFRLPLRTQAQLSKDYILETARSVQDVLPVVMKYQESAQQSLLFTKINAMEARHRNGAGEEFIEWSLSVQRPRPYFSGPILIQKQHISTRTRSNDAITSSWCVVETQVSREEVPDDLETIIQECRVRPPIKAGLAACITGLDAEHSFFSTLPLPIRTSLPVHLSASFILAEDRRTIRLDKYDTSSSQYNQWLLSTVLPPLYLFLLEVLLRENGENRQWWPGNFPKSVTDPLTHILLDAFYSNYLTTSNRRVFSSYYHPEGTLLPDEAVLMRKGLLVAQFLLRLRPRQITQLPSKVLNRIIEGSISSVDSIFMRNQILQAAEGLVSAFRADPFLKEIIDVVKFIKLAPDGVTNLLGLPLLPLLDGRLAYFEKDTSRVYYVWKPTIPAGMPLFEPARIIHPEFPTAELLDVGLNLQSLNSEGVQELIRAQMPEVDERVVSEADRLWISTFWEEYPHLEVAPETVASFPLVPTEYSDRYVSLSWCKTSHVIICGRFQQPWLRSALQTLGGHVVYTTTCPDNLRSLLESGQFPALNFSDVLAFLETIQSSIPECFSRLENKTHDKLASWIRERLSSTPSNLINVARCLPIWPANVGSTTSLHPASVITMLPSQVAHAAAAPFLQTLAPIAAYSSALAHLKVEPLRFDQFRDLLDLSKNQLIRSENLHSYRILLELFIQNRSQDPRDVLVPNGNRVLVESRTLYTREPLFSAAFGSAPDSFIEGSFSDLEPQLHSFGLQSTANLDMDMFHACAAAIDQSVQDDRILPRAALVFRVYCEDMPLRIRSNEQYLWAVVDSLRFIPRDRIRQRSMQFTEDSEYVRHLPVLVSPDEVLRPGLEAIAWTQRALFLPDERILVTNRALGVPKASEVVHHLRTLALRIACDYTSDDRVLKDIKATYAWLSEHSDEAKTFIIQHHSEPLFLNVEDPTRDLWRWHSADQLVFNDFDSGDLYAVQPFLVPYKNLLVASSVQVIEHPPCPPVHVTPNDHILSSLRVNFDAMRRDERFTDVVFVLNDPESESRFPAHRCFLAAISDHFRDLFCGEFIESQGQGPVTIPVVQSPEALKAVLDHMYTDGTPDTEDLNELLEIVELSHFWALLELNDKVQARIIGLKLITQDTCEAILRIAEKLGAILLLKACRYYEEHNRSLFRNRAG